jgi:hypothetical protein
MSGLLKIRSDMTSEKTSPNCSEIVFTPSLSLLRMIPSDQPGKEVDEAQQAFIDSVTGLRERLDRHWCRD